MQEARILSFHTPFERNMGKMWHRREKKNREETSRQLREARWVKKEERSGQEASMERGAQRDGAEERGRTRGQGRKRTTQRGVISENIGGEANQKGNLKELQYFSYSFLTLCPPTLLHSAGPLCKQTNLHRQGQGLVRRV